MLTTQPLNNFRHPVCDISGTLDRFSGELTVRLTNGWTIKEKPAVFKLLWSCQIEKLGEINDMFDPS